MDNYSYLIHAMSYPKIKKFDIDFCHSMIDLAYRYHKNYLLMGIKQDSIKLYLKKLATLYKRTYEIRETCDNKNGRMYYYIDSNNKKIYSHYVVFEVKKNKLSIVEDYLLQILITKYKKEHSTNDYKITVPKFFKEILMKEDLNKLSSIIPLKNHKQQFIIRNLCKKIKSIYGDQKYIKYEKNKDFQELCLIFDELKNFSIDKKSAYNEVFTKDFNELLISSLINPYPSCLFFAGIRRSLYNGTTNGESLFLTGEVRYSIIEMEKFVDCNTKVYKELFDNINNQIHFLNDLFNFKDQKLPDHFHIETTNF